MKAQETVNALHVERPLLNRILQNKLSISLGNLDGNENKNLAILTR